MLRTNPSSVATVLRAANTAPGKSRINANELRKKLIHELTTLQEGLCVFGDLGASGVQGFENFAFGDVRSVAKFWVEHVRSFNPTFGIRTKECGRSGNFAKHRPWLSGLIVINPKKRLSVHRALCATQVSLTS